MVNLAKCRYNSLHSKPLASEGDAIPLRRVTDGTENTLVIVEVAGAGIHWMQPRDVPVNVASAGINKAPRLGVCSRHPKGVQAVFADGSVRFLNEWISQANWEAVLTPAAGDVPHWLGP